MIMLWLRKALVENRAIFLRSSLVSSTCYEDRLSATTNGYARKFVRSCIGALTYEVDYPDCRIVGFSGGERLAVVGDSPILRRIRSYDVVSIGSLENIVLIHRIASRSSSV